MRAADRSRRVLMVTEQYFPDCGGTERQLQLLVRVLRGRGVDVEVVTPRSRLTYARHELVDGVRVTRLPFVRVRYLAMLSSALILTLFLLRRRRHFDVIHAHTVDYYAAVATAVGRLLRKPVLLKAVGAWELQRGLLNAERRRHLAPRLSLAVLRQATVWIALSRELREAMLRAGVPASRVKLVPNGVDTACYCPGRHLEACRQLGLSADRRHVLFVGRLAPEKGLPTLLRAWQDVARQVTGAHLHLVGDGALRSVLETEVDRLGIADAVTFHGEQPNVVAYLQAADCFVLPSMVEGMSNALLEAMAAGVPPVATDIPGSSALVTHGETGILVPVNEPHELATAIVTLLTDTGRAASIGARARAHIQQHFGIDTIANTYARFYQKELIA